jgi:hypothetical protein
MRKNSLFCALILAGFACSSFAQETAGNQKVPRRLLLSVECATGAYAKEEILVIQKSLALALANAGNGLEVIESRADAFPASPEGRIDAAEKEGADCWLAMEISGERTAPVMKISSFDVLFRTSIMEKTISRRQELSMREMSLETWADVVPLLAEKYVPVDSGLAGSGPKLARITLIATPGTTVEVLRGQSIVTGADGKAEVSVGVPATYELKASHAGYLPLEQRLFLEGDKTIDLTLDPYSRWTVDLSFFNAFNAGVEAGYFFIPGRGFLKLGLTSFLLGLALDSEGPFSSYNLFNLDAGVGFFLNPEASAFRVYLAFGGFLRIVFPRSSLLIDPLSPGGFQFALGAQVPVSSRSRIFAEYVPMVYFTDSPDLFRASLGEKDDPFGYIFQGNAALSLANLRFGIRWLP